MKISTLTTEPYPISQETAASAFHLSDTLDWASLSAQVKNSVIIVPAYSIDPPTYDQDLGSSSE